MISTADQIEAHRIPTTEKTVFSYRYNWNDQSHSLFADSSWTDYRRESLLKSNKSSFVLQTDIADFYARVNHHRLEAAKKR